MRIFFATVLCAAATATAAFAATAAEATQQPAGPPKPLTIEAAIQHSIDRNPSIAAGRRRISAEEARAVQAGLMPNPKLELESENFGGRGERAGFNVAETTAVISQEIPLGGKRGRRREVGELKTQLAHADLEVVILDSRAATSSAFYRVLAARQRVDMDAELLELAERFADSVRIRVEAGKVSPIEATRAGIEVSQTRIALSRSKRELDAARTLLAATWGSSTVDFDAVVGDLPASVTPPSLELLLEHLNRSPDMRRLEVIEQRQTRVVDLEHSNRIPDLTISAGPRWYEETGGSAWVAGLSIPIPIFDRNQGDRRAAGFELERTRLETEAERIRLQANLAATLERLRAVTTEVERLTREIVPAAEDAFVATETGYLGGKLGFLNVLDAQRALFDARSMLLAGREEYALIRTEVERLIGRALPDVSIVHGTTEWGAQ
jgi:cobalt-zinc-cadmium efflux system outer membrane protein